MDPELEALWQQTLASGASPAEMTATVFRAAQAKGISPDQLPNITSLSTTDINNGMQALQQAQRENVGAPSGIPTGLRGAEMAFEGGLRGGIDALRQGAGQARADLGRGAAGFQPFAGAGQQAGQRQAALSGALGPEAQAQAFREFEDSPGTQFLRERGERGVLGQSAALGGLGGANVMKRLSEFNQGLALQGLSQQQGQLSDVAGRGLQAVGGQAGLYGQQGQIANQLGGNVANLVYGTGQNLAQGRSQFGRDLANTLTGGSQNIAGLQSQQGTDLSALLAASGGNLANLLSGQGMASGNIATQLGSGLAGSAQTASGQRAGLPGIPGVQQTEGMAGGIADTAAAIGTMMALSDRRLKENIQKIGETDSGTNIYKWDWIKGAELLAGNQPGFGVMADEVPGAVTVGADGFKRVDYSKVR